MMVRHRLLWALGALLLSCAFAAPAEASHFRYGEIRCTPTGAQGGLEYQCYTKLAWRRTFSGQWDQIGDTYNIGFGIFGPGVNTSVSVTHTVIAINTSEDWSISEGTFTYTFPQDNQLYRISFTGNARIGTLHNRANLSWEVFAYVLSGDNATPRASIPPVVGYNQSSTPGVPAIQNFPAFDPDGDDIQCVLAPPNDVGGGPHPTGFSISTDCVMSWDNASILPGLWTTQIYVQQLDASGNVVQSSAFDFIMELGSTTNNTPPTCELDGIGPYHFHNNDTIDVFVGDNLEFEVIGEDANGDDVEVSITTPLGIGETYFDDMGNVIVPPFGVQPEPFSITVQKDPLVAADIGTHQFTASVSDVNGGTSQPCQLIVRVNALPTACTPIFVLDDFDTTDGSEFFDITNTSATGESLNRCTAATYNVFTATLDEVFDLDGITVGPGETFRAGNPGVPDVDVTFPSGTLPEPWGFGLIDNGVTSGDHVNTFVSDIVTSVIYLGENAVYLFLHTDPALDALYCGFYAGRIAGNSPEVCRVGAPVSRALAGSPAEAFLAELDALRASLGEADAATSDEAAHASSLPEAYALGTNVPNPFRGTTAISFALPEASDVRLTVYDVLGRQVVVLAEGAHEAGRYAVSFDPAMSGLPSGTYLYRLEAGDYVETRRMTLLK